MTHTNTTREVHNFGDLMAEVLEIDITSIDRAGEEDNVAPTHVDRVKGFAAHLIGGRGNVSDMDFGWNETDNRLLAHNGSDGEAANNVGVGDVSVTWWGKP